jgi:hypothetical protein
VIAKALHPLAGVAICLGSPAAAQKPLPPIPDWQQSQFEEADPAVRSVYILAVCTRNHRRELAEALLETRSGSPEEAILIPQALPSGLTDCPIRAGKVRISSEIFLRGAIAEALYNGNGSKPRSNGVLPFTEAFPDSGHGNRLMVARWVARCAVRRSPQGAHAVVRYNPGAIGERRALLDLEPIFRSCLPSGERLEISRLKFRAMIAEELYHASLSFKEFFANAHR